MTVPSIKATWFQLTADWIAKLLAKGTLTQADLEKRLLPEDLQYLGRKLAASSWVPMATLTRVAELAVEAAYGEFSPDEIRKQGERGARRIHDLGLYQQFEASSDKWGANVGRVSLTLVSVAYNFMRWSFEPGEDRQSARVVVEDARHFPEFSRYVSEGFMEYMHRVATKGEVEVTSVRPTPDKVVFSIRAKRASQ